MAVMGAALGSMAVAGPALAADAPGKADIQIVIDTTPTMGPSIAKAKEDATKLLSTFRGWYPDARFAVAEFRDLNYDDPSADGPEDADEHDYVLRQALTADDAAFQAALDRVQVLPGKTTWDPPAFAAESYNLAFRRSYDDVPGQPMGWRPDARKFVVVVGDSEPYGAQNEGFDGCDNRAADPYGLSTKAELAAMRANERTLVMVLQTEAIPDKAAKNRVLRCYNALSAASFKGGDAQPTQSGGTAPVGGGVPGSAPVGRPGLVQPIVNAVANSLGKLGAKADKRVYAPRSVARLSVTFSNPNAFAVRLATIKVGLPKGAFVYVGRSSAGATRKDPARAGRVLTWKVGKAVKARGSITLRFRVLVPAKAGRYAFTSSATSLLPNAGGAVVTSSLKAPTGIVVRRAGR
jgi:hypothetical protein